MKNTILSVILFFLVIPTIASANPSALQSGFAMGNAYGNDYGIYQNPSRLMGSDAFLTIQNQRLTGHLGGGAYQVTIGVNEAIGNGPMGPINLHMTRLPIGDEIHGVWNGAPVHFLVGETAIKGQAMRRVSASIGYRSCRYDLTRFPGRPAYSGLVECMGRETPSRFELKAGWRTEIAQTQNVILLLACLLAPASATAH